MTDIFKTIIKPNNLLHIDTHIIDNIHMYINNLPAFIVKKLVNKMDNYDKLNFMGKGDEGTVYSYDNMVAVKFFVNSNNRELKFMEILKDLYDKSIIYNTLILYKSFIKDGYLVTITNLADGTVDKWLKKNSKSNIDKKWCHMMLQILYGLLILKKKLLMYHKDMLHRNILYKTFDKSIKIKYIINDTIIKFKTKTLFFISDFGKSQSLLFKDNTLSNEEIEKHINDNIDLEGVASLFNKMLVDYIYHNADHTELYKFVENNTEINNLILETERKMIEKTKIFKKPSNYVRVQVFRALCYYLIEYNLIDTDKYIKENNVFLPSKHIKHILESLSNDKPIITKMIEINEILKK